MDIKPLPVHLASPRSWISRLLFHPTRTPCWSGTLIEFGSCVWLRQSSCDIDPFESGLFGKGSLSRAKPTWKSRTIDKGIHYKKKTEKGSFLWGNFEETYI